MTWDPQETARQARLVAEWEASMDVREEMACGTLWHVRGEDNTDGRYGNDRR
jgi:hypothetical protein